MEKYLLLKKYADTISAEEEATVLKEHSIPYIIEDKSLQFRFDKDGYDLIHLKVSEDDFSKSKLLLNEYDEKKISELGKSHYLYTFSDKDIIDITANPEDWTNAEIKLAKQIITERQLNITEDSIQNLQQKFTENKIDKTLKRNKSVWFLFIAILSILNSVFFYSGIKIRFIFGIGITELIERIIINQDIPLLPVISNLLFGGFFLFIWIYAKKNEEWAFKVGLILYLFDSVYLFLMLYWIAGILHIIISIFIYLAYKKVKIELEKINK